MPLHLWGTHNSSRWNNANVEAIRKMVPKGLVHQIIQPCIWAVKTVQLDFLHRFLNEQVWEQGVTWFRSGRSPVFPLFSMFTIQRFLTLKFPVKSLTPGTGLLSCASGWECSTYLALTHTPALLNCFSFKISAEEQFNEAGKVLQVLVILWGSLKTLCFCKFKYQYKIFSEQKVCHKLIIFINFLL